MKSRLEIKTAEQKAGSGTSAVRTALVLGGILFAAACVPVSSSSDAQQQSLEAGIEKATQIAESIKCLVPAPANYKQLWMDINAPDNLLGRALMTHYMGCSGKTYRLSEAEFGSLPLMLVQQEFGSIFLSRPFIDDAIKNRIGKVGDKIVEIDETVIASTHYGNTLGHFQLSLRGHLYWKLNNSGQIVPQFSGQAKVADRYDFNPSESALKDSWRGNDTELRVRLAHIGLPGKAFDIESDWFNFKFDYPRFDSDLIQESINSEKSGYSAYGEQVQVILMTELRSARWEKASALERIKILMTTMRRIHEATRQRKS